MHLKSEIKFIAITCNTISRTHMLEKCLDSLKHLKKPENIRIEIIVADNDIEGSARQTVEKAAKNSTVKIHYFIEEKRGLSFARNKLLKEAVNLGATHIAIIDDDDIADENWLINLVDMYNNHPEASIISGPEYAVFDAEYPKFLTQNNIFAQTTTKKKGEIRPTSSTHNSFFPTSIMTEENIWFDPSFVFMGGEDGDFFSKAQTAGYVIAFNPDAIVREINDKNRVNINWILNRNFYNGYSGSYLKFKNKKYSLSRIFYILKTFAITLIDLIFVPLSLLGGLTFFLNTIGLICKNAGKCMGAITPRPLDYYKNLNGGIVK